MEKHKKLCGQQESFAKIDDLLLRQSVLIENIQNQTDTDAYLEANSSEFDIYIEETEPQIKNYKSSPSQYVETQFKPLTLDEIEQVFAAQDEQKPDSEDISAAKIPKKRGKLLGNLLFYTAILAILIIGISCGMSGNGTKNIAGYCIVNVLSSSMQSEIPQGSLVMTKRVDCAEIEIGDDITFMAGETSSVTHRVIGIVENYMNSGERGFETKGIDNEKPDKDTVWAKNVVGKVIFHIPYVGSVMETLKKHWLLAILPFFGVLIFTSLMKFIFSKESPSSKK